MFWMPLMNLSAQQPDPSQPEKPVSARFVKPESSLKAGDLSFNIIRVYNHADTAIRIKPILLLPQGWGMLSNPFLDTLIRPGDSISLSFRFRLPGQVSSEVVHSLDFKAYSMKNAILAECQALIHSEVYHDWEVVLPEERIFFYPRSDQAKFSLKVNNQGNATEHINLTLEADYKVELNGSADRIVSRIVTLAPYTDTTLNYDVRYKSSENRVFDICKVQVNASTPDNSFSRPLMVEKYSDIYSPLFIDRQLPHEVETGIRTFSGNREFLPFIKARGFSVFKNRSSFIYNFNYYSVTGNEDFLSNSYYTFLYQFENFKAGIGAFSSPLGRNLYTRSGVMLNNSILLAPWFGMEAFICQSFFYQKTSGAIGYTFQSKKVTYHGSYAYDVDNQEKVNTASAMFQTSLVPIGKNQAFTVNLYGYHEKNYRFTDYSQAGIAWDINYIARFWDRLSFQFINNYGSPDIPGSQMGLVNFSIAPTLGLGNGKQSLSVRYVNASRKYSNYTIEGNKLPENKMYDQYINFLFHSSQNPNHIFDIGPCIENYISHTPSTASSTEYTTYRSQKLRLEYKGVIRKKLTINLKGGLNNITYVDDGEIQQLKYDFHFLGNYSFLTGYAITVTYDYGPMVNTGLYQFANDVKNNSFTVGPTIMDAYFQERLAVSLFASYIYRFDLKYSALNVNPKIETYIAKNWYVGVSGTYHYTRQEYRKFVSKSDYTYIEFSIKKKWGKTDFNQWYKDTRSLKIVLFQDDNANGIKDYGEQGIPFVKTRVKLTNAASDDFTERFPVDITLLSNDAGVVVYNRLPVGFYDIQITPLIDLKEYFYVNRSAEKVELSQSTTYYIPFQKATKIQGYVNIKREKFIQKGQENIDLANIRVTAYNKQGNSYSAFTLDDGSFTIFVPGNIEYFVRMENVFGSRFKIPKNDILITPVYGSNNEVTFDVVESSRQVAFKKAEAAAPADTVQQQPLKIKVLSGKFYENKSDTTVDKSALPQFNMPEVPVEEQQLIAGNYYIVLWQETDKELAFRQTKVFRENGFTANFGFDATLKKYCIYTNYYPSAADAKKEADLLKKAGVTGVQVIKY
jgi:hypothetical protein